MTLHPLTVQRLRLFLAFMLFLCVCHQFYLVEQNTNLREDLASRSVDSVFIPVPVPSDADVLLLARLINSETHRIDTSSNVYEAFLGKLAVGETVVNRATSKILRQVIYAKGQFDGIRTRRFRQQPKPADIVAAYRALMKNELFLPDVYYFLNPETSTDRRWVRKVKGMGAHAGSYADHEFYTSDKVRELIEKAIQ